MNYYAGGLSGLFHGFTFLRFLGVSLNQLVQHPVPVLIMIVCVVGIGITVWYSRNRTTDEEDPATPEEEAVKPPIPSETSTKVRCHHCQHVQTVPVSSSTFECEQCKKKLQRKVTGG